MGRIGCEFEADHISFASFIRFKHPSLEQKSFDVIDQLQEGILPLSIEIPDTITLPKEKTWKFLFPDSISEYIEAHAERLQKEESEKRTGLFGLFQRTREREPFLKQKMPSVTDIHDALIHALLDHDHFVRPDGELSARSVFEQSMDVLFQRLKGFNILDVVQDEYVLSEYYTKLPSQVLKKHIPFTHAIDTWLSVKHVCLIDGSVDQFQQSVLACAIDDVYFNRLNTANTFISTIRKTPQREKKSDINMVLTLSQMLSDTCDKEEIESAITHIEELSLIRELNTVALQTIRAGLCGCEQVCNHTLK
jgi:hypothetical protein